MLWRRERTSARYLQELEPRCQRWVQLLEDELDGLSDLLPSTLDKIKSRGCYGWRREADNKNMVEFHEDDIDDIEELRDKPRRISIRATHGGKRLVLLGQD
jgi:hypothetical protein